MNVFRWKKAAFVTKALRASASLPLPTAWSSNWLGARRFLPLLAWNRKQHFLLPFFYHVF
jgi:hypothetical protein